MDTQSASPASTTSPIAEGIPTIQKTTPASGGVPRFPLKTLAIGAGVVIGLLVLIFIVKLVADKLQGSKTASIPTKKVALTWWGLWEPNEVLSSEIKQFETQNPGVTITYSQQSVKDYRDRLQGAFSRNQGPDIFRFHNTWVPMLAQAGVLSTLPSSTMSSSEYQNTFYPTVIKDMQLGSGYAGIPLMTDGLALFINKKSLAASGKSAPTTWEELSSLAKDLTIKTADGKIDRAGIALGSANNVDHFSDIMALLILQNGGNPGNPSDTKNLVSDALTFYTQFLRVDKVWDETLPNSTYAFAIEKSAMIFAPSWRAFEIKQINPNLDFAVFPVPQLPGKPVTFASYWVEGVAKSSPNQEIAWKFLKFMSGKENLTRLYTAMSSQRLFGEIYPRSDMASLLTNDPYAGAFIKQAPTATSWYMSSRTFDNGVNDQIIKYYQDAVNSINAGKGNAEVLPTLTSGVASTLTKYNIKP